MADPYVYPGTLVLRNLLDLREAGQLQIAERLLTAERLERLPPDVPMSYDGYKALHRHLFVRLYEWAGTPRSVNLIKGETIFAPPGRVDPLMERQFTLMGHERFLKDLTPERFASRAGAYINEINVIHPFREGNGRTLRAFLEVLARQAGHAVDVSRINPAAWNAASIAGVAVEYQPMTDVIQAALVRAGEGREVTVPRKQALSDAFRERSRKAAQQLGADTPVAKRPDRSIDID